MTARVVRHDQLGHTAHEMQRPGHAFNPVDRLLAGGGQGVGVARCAHGRHEDVSAAAVTQRQCGAGKIDKQLLPGTVDLAHRALEGFCPAPVMLAVLGVLVGSSFWVIGLILLPQQHQGHALAAEFAVDLREIGLPVVRAGAIGQPPWQQSGLQLCLWHGLDQRPVQACGLGQGDVFGDHAFGDFEDHRCAFERVAQFKLVP